MCIPALAWGEALGPGNVPATAKVPVHAAKPDRINLLLHMVSGADRGPVRALAARQGGKVRYEYKNVLPKVMNLRNMPLTAVAALEKIPGVFKIEEDKYHEKLIKLDESTPLINGLQSQIQSAGYTNAAGSGVRVCVVDTGIDTDHIMYSSRIDSGAGYDYVNNDSLPEDDHGHGSHVAGIAVGGTGLSINFSDVCDGNEPFQGVAPDATLIGVKVLNSQGGGYISDVIYGIDHCVSVGADVINLSLGAGSYSGICDTDSLAKAANQAVESGVVVVAASGNEGYANSMITPACGSQVIAVGATYKADYPRCEASVSSFSWCLDSSCATTCTDTTPVADDLVCFSNKSDYLDVVAPGSVIWSAGMAEGGLSITQKSGTSMAAPQVAGLAALILGEDTALTPAQVREIIRNGAIDMGTQGFDSSYGYGRVDVLQSLALLESPQCIENTDCDDSDSCTTDTCSAGVCDNQPIECPQGEICVAGFCSPLPPVCGNGFCEEGEKCDVCPADCISGGGVAVCGNGVCEPESGENCLECPQDCSGKQIGTTKRQYCCGDGEGVNPVVCDDPRCTQEGWLCSDTQTGTYCCGDGVCEGAEDYVNCAVDNCIASPFCGDGNCDPGEDQCSCSGDCGSPPTTETNCTDTIDNDCDGNIDSADPDCSNSVECLLKREPCGSNDACCSNRCLRGFCK
ncbi:MAG: S8 family serine peptidase [Desulfobulbaceae bacterium]|nr:S8 family serine peptidase [Desulfobulbaceae bacterium]